MIDKTQMRYDGRSKFHGRGHLDIIFTSCKKIILINVFYVPNMNKDLISGDLWNMEGINLCMDQVK